MTKTAHSSRLFQVFVVALLAAGLLLLAVPRMKSSVRFLPVDQAIDRYFEDRVIPSNRMATLTEFARDAIGTHDSYPYRDGLSLLHYLRGLDIHTPAMERRGEYIAAELEAIETVKRAPAQPEAWLRIAKVRDVLHEEPKDILAPWRMSVFTGRTHSMLLAPRVALGLPLLQDMDAESRGMLRDQLLLGWEMKPADLYQVLSTRDPQLEATRDLLSGTAPSLLSELEARFEKNR